MPHSQQRRRPCPEVSAVRGLRLTREPRPLTSPALSRHASDLFRKVVERGTLAELEREHGSLPTTAKVLSGGGGQHLYFRHPGVEVRNSASRLGPGLDVRADGGYICAPPSVHASGRLYRWTRALERQPLAELPAWLAADARERRNGAAPPVENVIPEGARRRELLSLAGTLRRRGLGAEEILATLAAVNGARCRPPLYEHELHELAGDVASRYEPDPSAAIRTEPAVDGRTLANVIATFEEWLHLPDPGAVYAVLATVAANRVVEFDPYWN